MRFKIGIIVLALLVLSAAAVDERLKSARTAGSTVKLLFGEDNHCSGTHLGGGLVLTAQHCTDKGEILIEDDKGRSGSSEVLWSNQPYDLAMIKTGTLVASSSPVECATPTVGEKITVSGNPFNLSWVATKGEVVSPLHSNSTWKEVIAADVTVGGGNSGGPVFDMSGHVVGVLVGQYSSSRLALFVPGKTVCEFLGRGH